MKIINEYENELSADELKALAVKVEIIVAELKEMLSLLLRRVTDSVIP